MQPHHPNKSLPLLKAILFCTLFTGVFFVLSFIKGFVPANLERLAHGLLGTLAGLLVTVVFLKWEGRKFSDIGLYFDRQTVKRFLMGALAGVLIMGLLAAGVMYFTGVKVELNPRANAGMFLLLTAPLIPLAFMEELGFRGYPLQVLKDKWGIWGSLVITSILFALYHVANGWSIASSFLGPAVWGLLFGLAAIYSKGLAMATGLHYAANLTTSAFGEPGNQVSIWTVTAPSSSLGSGSGIDWPTIIPAFILLLVAIMSIEVYRRRNLGGRIGQTE